MMEQYRRCQAFLAALLVLALILEGYGGIIKPTDQIVNAGEIALFECSGNDTVKGLPQWTINDNTYHHNRLPADHWFNESGLVVLATETKNGSTYRCRFLYYEIYLGSPSYVDEASPPAVLTVLSAGASLSDSVDQRGPHVLETLTYPGTGSLRTQWCDTPATAGSRGYRLNYFTCDGTSLATFTTPATCTNTEVSGLGMTGNKLLEVQVCPESGVCGFRLPTALAPGTVEAQNVIGVNYSSQSFVPELAPAVSPQPATCLFTSNLTGACSITEIYIEVFSTGGKNYTYSAMELDSTGSDMLLETNTFGADRNNFRLCIRNSINPSAKISALFGNVDQVIVQERCLLQPCPNKRNLFVSYYGMQARININSSPASVSACSISYQAMPSEVTTSTPTSFSIISSSIMYSTYTSIAPTSCTPAVTSTPEEMTPQAMSSTVYFSLSIQTSVSPGAIAGITAILILITATIVFYIVFGVIAAVIWRRKHNEWLDEEEEDKEVYL